MREEVAIILTASAPEFGDLVPLMNFLLQAERTVLLALKLHLKWIITRALGQSLQNLTFHFMLMARSLPCGAIKDWESFRKELAVYH